jgi:hypothetical protein
MRAWGGEGGGKQWFIAVHLYTYEEKDGERYNGWGT